MINFHRISLVLEFTLSIHIENFVDTQPDTLAKLYDIIDNPQFCLCLDVGHAHVNSSVNVEEWINILGSRIGHVHLHNNDKSGDLHWPLGEGTIDMDYVVNMLTMKSPNATFTIEAAAQPSLSWLIEHKWLTSRGV
jgi:sugar phosphate isomerase/epimerase